MYLLNKDIILCFVFMLFLLQSFCSTVQWGGPTAAGVERLTQNTAAFGAADRPALAVCIETPALMRSNTPALHLSFTL